MVKHEINIFPTRWGKLTTTFQMLSVILVFLQWQMVYLFWWVAAFFTVVSGMDYIRKGFSILYALDNHHNSN